MSENIQGVCPEPVYPKELRASASGVRFEGVEDLGPEGEGRIIFDASSPRVLCEELGRLPRLSARAWINSSSEAYIRRVSYEAVVKGFQISPDE